MVKTCSFVVVYSRSSIKASVISGTIRQFARFSGIRWTFNIDVHNIMHAAHGECCLLIRTVRRDSSHVNACVCAIRRDLPSEIIKSRDLVNAHRTNRNDLFIRVHYCRMTIRSLIKLFKENDIDAMSHSLFSFHQNAIIPLALQRDKEPCMCVLVINVCCIERKRVAQIARMLGEKRVY